MRKVTTDDLAALNDRLNRLEALPARLERAEQVLDALALGFMRVAREVEAAIGGHHGQRIRIAAGETVKAVRALLGRLPTPEAPPVPRSIEGQLDVLADARREATRDAFREMRGS